MRRDLRLARSGARRSAGPARHGFNTNVYEAWDTGGNSRAIQYVADGLNLQGCGPGLVVARAEWEGTCREVVVTRDDGRQHRAFLRFV